MLLTHNDPPAPYPAPTTGQQTQLVSDSEPDPVYQIDLSRRWQMGDLVRQHGKLILIVAVGLERQHMAPDESGELILVRTYRELICLGATGHVWQANGPTERVDFLHNTDLQYDYQNREQVQRDFCNGLFTPYFEIL